MASPVRYIYGTEVQILALTVASPNWIDRAFYYPTDKDYFYQASNGIMKKYGSGELSGVGIRLNGSVLGGVKNLIQSSDILEIPENYEYNVYRLGIEGIVNCEGIINLIS